MGLNHIDCIDLLDACNSHVRGWYLGKTFLDSGIYDWVMVLSVECRSGLEFCRGHLKERYAFKSKQELCWKFPALTLGDAVAVSLLVPDHHNQSMVHDDWHFETESKPSNAPLCYVNSAGARHFEPLVRAAISQSRFDKESWIEQPEGLLQFFCLYSDLERESVELVVNVWKRMRQRLGRQTPSREECLVTHCSNGSGWAGAARWAGFSEENHINLYSEFGNIVSCSVPGSIALAHFRGKLKSFKKINVWTGAAGSSYFAFQVPYVCWEN